MMLFFLSCFVAPLIQAVLNTVLLVKHFTLRAQIFVLRAAQIVSYWSALDCLFVGIIGMIIELGLIVDYVADVVTFDVCSNIQHIKQSAS